MRRALVARLVLFFSLTAALQAAAHTFVFPPGFRTEESWRMVQNCTSALVEQGQPCC